MENSIKQFSSEIRNLQTELKAEQQTNFVLENRFMTFECRLKEILINDTNQNYKKISVERAFVTNTSCKELKMSNLKSKKRR